MSIIRQAVFVAVVAALTACVQATATPLPATPAPTLTAPASDTPTPIVSSPTRAPSATPTLTPEPSSTPLPSATPSATPAPSATPDLQVLRADPGDMLLQRSELPAEGKYYLPGELWISPHHNAEIIGAWGDAEIGQAYLEATGRIDGWFVEYYRGTEKYLGPDEIYSNVIIYATAAGAQLTVTDYNEVMRGLPGDEDWEYDEASDFQIGDVSRLLIRKELLSSGKYWVSYSIQFAYRNYVVITEGYGPERAVIPELFEQLSQLQLEKLMAQPLFDTVAP